MKSGIGAFAALVLVVAASLAISADGTSQSQSGEVQLYLGHQFMEDGRYNDALEAFEKALQSPVTTHRRTAYAGIVRGALRLADFPAARAAAQDLVRIAPQDAGAGAMYGDALWAAGLFDEAEEQYNRALALSPQLARGHHGKARGLAARNRLDEALAAARLAAELSPRDMEIHHTIGSIYERMHLFEEAAGSFNNYLNLLPDRDQSDTAAWSRAEIKFLRSFGQRVPFELDPGAENEIFTIDFRLVNDKVVVRAKINDGSFQDFVVDTGAESTILSGPTARRLGVTPITYTLSAGVGGVGLRGLQLGRIDTLELGPLTLRNVPCLIKDPPLRDLPVEESESLSPLALGFSMIIDYEALKITLGKTLPEEPSDYVLPLRMHRLATVRGTLDGALPANFVVDTGGEVISISQASATALDRPEPERRIALKVFGSSGWDPDAFLMPGVNLAFDAIRYDDFPVVVLNLRTPSVLLGFQLGGIVGHRFLSRYRVAIDLQRSVLRLTEAA